MRYDNIKMLEDTLGIFKKGSYVKDGRTIYTKLSGRQMKECYVYLPDDVRDIMNRTVFDCVHRTGAMEISCRNIDSFGMAQERYAQESMLSDERVKNILVLNFANPVHPGGGVRRGARAQEEDLCRKSSLLYSLE